MEPPIRNTFAADQVIFRIGVFTVVAKMRKSNKVRNNRKSCVVCSHKLHKLCEMVIL